MHVLVHHIFYKPELTGTATYTAGLCERLARSGHQVEVICPPPYFPHWEVQRPYHSWLYSTETIEGVRVARCPVWLPKKPGGVGRILYELLFLLFSLPRLLRSFIHPPGLVIAVEPTLLSTIPVLAVGWLTGAHTWLHVQDFEMEIALSTHEIRRRWQRRLVRRFDAWIRRRFDTVSSISHRMCERLANKGVDPARIVYFPNWADTETIYPQERSDAINKLRFELGAGPDATLVLYSGTLNRKQAIDRIIDAAQVLRGRSDIVFAICGEGVELPRLQALARHLPNVRFLPLQPAGRLNDLLNAADIHVLTQRLAVADLVMPSKLLAMLASGRPVIAAAKAGTEIHRIVSQCGMITQPEDPHGLSRAISILSRDAEARRSMGERARTLAVEQFEAVRVLAGFEQEVNRRVSGFGPPPIPAEVRAGAGE
jgi:colanic acid biosynthesis glycosyl transferase WcaI